MGYRPPKKKGNPIITRYPPPPGYRGPAQPQGPFHAHHQSAAQYQTPPQSGFPQVPPAQTAYPGQSYSAAPRPAYPPASYGPPQPSGYPPSFPQGQNYQWPQQPYPPNQGPLHAPAHPATQGYRTSQAPYQPHPSHTATVDPSRQAYSQASGWPQAQSQSAYPPQSQYNGYSGPDTNDQPMVDSNPNPTPVNAHLASAPQATSIPSSSAPPNNGADRKPDLYLAWDDWDFDFDGAIWPKSNEPVDPNLSLGVIIWHPAKQVTRALPATFEEAEDQSLKPTPERLGNGESVSIYFTADNSHEAFLDVRQTDDWEFVKGDPAFVIFADDEMQSNLVPIEDCIAQRDRTDDSREWEAGTQDAEMHEADWSVMDNLEQALSANVRETKPVTEIRASESVRPPTQEDILASLGVTGLPKPVSGEPMPFPLPAQDLTSNNARPKDTLLHLQSKSVHSTCHHVDKLTFYSPASIAKSEPLRSQSIGSTLANIVHPAAQRSFGSISSSSVGPPPPPPPPAPPEEDRFDPWNTSSRHHHYHTSGFNGGRGSPARSEASNGTAAGSDFGTEKPAESSSNMSLTPGSKLERNESFVSRKRSYGDTGADEDGVRMPDDHMKRKRRSLVDAAYR